MFKTQNQWTSLGELNVFQLDKSMIYLDVSKMFVTCITLLLLTSPLLLVPMFVGFILGSPSLQMKSKLLWPKASKTLLFAGYSLILVREIHVFDAQKSYLQILIEESHCCLKQCPQHNYVNKIE